MNNSLFSFPSTTRREFLRHTTRGLGLLAFNQFAPRLLVDSAQAAPASMNRRRVLVLVQLAGGNDGLNTVVPFEDANYYRHRPTLAIGKEHVRRISDTLGFHPACTALHRLFQDGRVAVVQNVGYEDPNRSHFRSTEIWETASGSSEFLATGWIGRFMDQAGPSEIASADPMGVHFTLGLPQSFLSASRSDEAALGINPRFFEPGSASSPLHEKIHQTVAAYRPRAIYRDDDFGNSLRSIAALIAAGQSTQVYFVTLNGFDTHRDQAIRHAELLHTLSDGLAAFQTDLKAHGVDEHVITMTVSEFGRRLSENEDRGTDHGTAAPLFVVGARVNGGVYGTPPLLALEPDRDLSFSTDFRQVYATVIERWFQRPAMGILGGEFEPLPLLA